MTTIPKPIANVRRAKRARNGALAPGGRRNIMADTAAIKDIASQLRERASEIRSESDALGFGERQSHYPGANHDAWLLKRAATLLEQAAAELAAAKA
jgi:hypothetical protein